MAVRHRHMVIGARLENTDLVRIGGDGTRDTFKTMGYHVERTSPSGRIESDHGFHAMCVVLLRAAGQKTGAEISFGGNRSDVWVTLEAEINNFCGPGKGVVHVRLCVKDGIHFLVWSDPFTDTIYIYRNDDMVYILLRVLLVLVQENHKNIHAGKMAAAYLERFQQVIAHPGRFFNPEGLPGAMILLMAVYMDKTPFVRDEDEYPEKLMVVKTTDLHTLPSGRKWYVTYTFHVRVDRYGELEVDRSTFNQSVCRMFIKAIEERTIDESDEEVPEPMAKSNYPCWSSDDDSDDSDDSDDDSDDDMCFWRDLESCSC